VFVDVRERECELRVLTLDYSQRESRKRE